MENKFNLYDFNTTKNTASIQNPIASVKGRGPTNFFSDEQTAYDRMLNDGIDEITAKQVIKRRRDSFGLTNLQPTETLALQKMMADGIDSETASQVVKRRREKLDTEWAKAHPIKNIGRELFNVPVGAAEMATEQVGNVLDFATQGKAGFGQDVKKLKATTEAQGLNRSIGANVGKGILGVGEMVATGPTSIAKTSGGRILQSAAVGGVTGGVNPILEKGSKATLGDIGMGATIGGIAGGTIGSVLEGVPGKSLKLAGQKLYKTAIKPNANEAEMILKSKAGLMEAPTTRADTALKYGLTGTETGLGVKGLKTADKIFKQTINPALEKSTQTHNITDIFSDLEKEIASNKGGELRKQELLKGLNALKEDYLTIGKKNFTTKDLQLEKSSLDEFTPSKVFKGEDVVNGYNQVKAMLANNLRNRVREDLGKVGIANAKELYRDYANLVELSKIGVKGLTEGGLKGGFGTFWSTLYDKLATPIKTIGGKILYRTGDGLEFLGPKGIKKVGDFLKRNKLDIKDGNIITTGDSPINFNFKKNDNNMMDTNILRSSSTTGMDLNPLKPKQSFKQLTGQEILPKKKTVEQLTGQNLTTNQSKNKPATKDIPIQTDDFFTNAIETGKGSNLKNIFKGNEDIADYIDNLIENLNGKTSKEISEKAQRVIYNKGINLSTLDAEHLGKYIDEFMSGKTNKKLGDIIRGKGPDEPPPLGGTKLKPKDKPTPTHSVTKQKLLKPNQPTNVSNKTIIKPKKTGREVLKPSIDEYKKTIGNWKPTNGGYKVENIDVSKTNAFPRAKYHREDYVNTAGYKYWKEQIAKGKEITPVVVEKTDKGFYVLDGYHRLAAAEDSGVKNIKAVIIDNPVKKGEQAKGLKQFTTFTDKEIQDIANTQSKKSILKKILPSNFKEKAQDTVEKIVDKIGARTKLLGGEGAMKAPVSNLEKAKNWEKSGKS